MFEMRRKKGTEQFSRVPWNSGLGNVCEILNGPFVRSKDIEFILAHTHHFDVTHTMSHFYSFVLLKFVYSFCFLFHSSRNSLWLSPYCLALVTLFSMRKQQTFPQLCCTLCGGFCSYRIQPFIFTKLRSLGIHQSLLATVCFNILYIKLLYLLPLGFFCLPRKLLSLHMTNM